MKNLERLANVLLYKVDKLKAIEALEKGWKSTGLWGDEVNEGLSEFFLQGKINLAKHHFYQCGRIDEYEITKLNVPLLDYGLIHLGYALLSDEINLINRYANFTHSYYNKSIANGTATPVYIMQCIIKENWGECEKAIEIMKNKCVKKQATMVWDVQFFEGMVEKNKGKIEMALNELVSPKVHKIRNKHSILINEFISHPALGYAKLAWLKGIEVEVNSPLVPKDLLPVKPLDTYINEYAFLDEIELPAK